MRIPPVVAFSLLLPAYLGWVAPRAFAQKASDSMQISPRTVTLHTGQLQRFNATVSGTPITSSFASSVRWLVNGVHGGDSTAGTISHSGLYKAPGDVTSGSIVVTAQSVSDPSAVANAKVTMKKRRSVSVSVSPTRTSLQIRQSMQFTATVSGTEDTSVEWLVDGAPGGNETVGMISSAGLYAAPAAVPSGGAVTVTAQSMAQSTATGSAAVTVLTPVPITVSVTPPSASVQVGQTAQFSATVSGTTNQVVNWLVNGAMGGSATFGTVSATGLYTAPATVPPSAVTVTAQSAAQSTATGSAAVTVTIPITVSVTPPSANLQVGQSQPFSATVSGTTNNSVTWLVNGAAGGNPMVGTISSAGMYTAPAAVPSGGNVTVTAQSVAQTSATGSAGVTINQAAIPAAPTNVTATGGNGQVALSWSASSGANSYDEKRSTTSGGPYTTVASPTTTSYTDTGLTNGTTYYYVVTAVNTAGESSNSSQVSATPQPGIPAAPTNATATGGNGQVALSWSASSGATSYNVKRSTTSGGPYATVASPTTTSYTDTGLTNGTTYYYVVTAVNTAGESSNSSQVSATPQPGIPAAPTNATATGGNGQVALSWSASSGATSYNGKRSTTSGGPYATVASPTTTSYTDTGLTNGTTYYYVVTAVNTAGESSNSSQVSATPQPGIPAAPTNATATGGNGQVALSWSASSGATSYNGKRSTTSGGPYATVASPTTTSYTDTGLTNGTTYYYVVTAVNTA